MLNLTLLHLKHEETKESYIAIFCTNAKSNVANEKKIDNVVKHFYKLDYIHCGDIENIMTINYMDCLNNDRLYNSLLAQEFYKDYTVTIGNKGKVSGDIKLFKSDLSLEVIVNMFKK